MFMDENRMPSSAREIGLIEESRKQKEEEQRRRNRVDMSIVGEQALLPVIQTLQEQNTLLQVQIEEAKASSERAEKEARKTKIESRIAFVIATIISIASLIVSLIK